MKYTIYKLEFQTGVHFGTGALDECTYTFHADQIFSAMYIEALKLGIDQKFYDAVKAGTLLFSDALPYMGQQYMIPKPMIYVTSGRQGESEQKKAYKKLKYLPVEQLDEFLKGSINFKADVMKDYGQLRQQTMAYVRKEEDTLPFRVGTFYYAQGCGLYLIVAYASEEELSLAEELLESLSYTGIGGKKSSGMGKFEFRRGKPSEELEKRLQKKSSKNTRRIYAEPFDVLGGECAVLEIIEECTAYLLEKRSGFVASSSYAPEWRKKKDLYVFSPGSCFVNRFAGDIYDVSDGGRHAVYRYAKALFLGV